MNVLIMERANKLLSIIVPAMNEEENIGALTSAVRAEMEKAGIPYELIIVDDGSRDGTWERICRAAEEDARVRGISFSRNFGKEGAMFAGLDRARGGCAVIFDADLQFPPPVISEMYRIWLKGECDVVDSRKNSRGKESFVYKAFTGAFYGLLKLMSGIDLNNASDFKLMDRRVIDALDTLGERQTFFRAMSGWVGFKTETVRFDVAERHAGSSKWSPKKLVKFALGSISSFTSAPLQFATYLGGFFLFAAVVLTVVTLACSFKVYGTELFCWSLTVMLAIGGTVLIALGILGFYLSRVYDEIKGRPRYIVAKTTDSDDGAGRR
jgi:glycosyltransferase involved in cell wall biosynthesis